MFDDFVATVTGRSEAGVIRENAESSTDWELTDRDIGCHIDQSVLLREGREGESLDLLAIKVADLAVAARPGRAGVFGQCEGTRIQDDTSSVRIGPDDGGQHAERNVASITAPEMELNEVKEDIVSRSYFGHTGEVLGVHAGGSGADRDLGTGNASVSKSLGKRDGDRALLERNPTDLLHA